MFETRVKSITKALSWRISASLITASIVYFLTESAGFAVQAGIAGSLIKIFTYHAHKRARGRFNYGKALHPPADLTFRQAPGGEDRRIIREKPGEPGYVLA